MSILPQSAYFLRLAPAVLILLLSGSAFTAGPAPTPAVASFAAGCFWHTQEAFQKIKGVLDTEVGYSGGNKPEPTYEQVCTSTTGHAETVQIKYDPAVLSYEQLLAVFFGMHDPTTPNQQGPDVGPQYRSIIFYHSAEQKAAAQEFVAGLEASHRFNRPIVTEIVPAQTFWRAEEYHQKYFEKHHRLF